MEVTCATAVVSTTGLNRCCHMESAAALSTTGFLENLSYSNCQGASLRHCLQLQRVGLGGTRRRGTLLANSITAGLVDGLVDEILRISKAGGSMVMNGTNFGEPIRQISGRMSFFPAQRESVFNGILSSAAPVLDGKEATVTLEKPMLMDAVRQGRMIENLLLYRQTYVIRSYEVGADKTASIETLMNLFQETALNHVWLSGIGGDGFGTTKAMVRSGLIWVVSRMHVEVDRYPAWGEVVEMDSWVASSGKNGMRRDWLLRNMKTGQVLARATSTWVMMHSKTRKLSKMPVDVRAEISPYFLEKHACREECSLKINKLQDESALYKTCNLQARRTDLDMNQHVNNVKYIGWMMESVPPECLERLEIKSLTLEYRRECGQTDLVESLTNPEQVSPLLSSCTQPGINGTSAVREVAHPEFPYLSGTKMGVTMRTVENQISLICEPDPSSQFTHLLKMQADGAEIVRGRSLWKLKPPSSQMVATHN